MRRRLKVGLLGLGRLGKVYARDLAASIPYTELVAVADPDDVALRSVAEEYEVRRAYADPLELIGEAAVEAVVIVSPTHTHKPLVAAAAETGKAIFCEKPLSISPSEAAAMRETVERTGVFFQMGFMRRFDRGYAAAKERIDAGELGKPVVFKSSSRDPFRPSLEYLHPDSSGGIFVDMGIHDFDLALWLFGPIQEVHSVGGVLAYPEIESVGDIDNAIVNLTFADGRIGTIDLSRNGVYGYDIRTEILGTEGTIRIGYLRETPITILRKNQVSHDTVPYFMERFAEAYTRQLENFALNALESRPPPVGIDDGIAALDVAVAATKSYRQGRPCKV